MDFFARQAATRRQSRWMVFLFIIAVIAIVIAIDLVVVTTVAILSVQDDGGLLATPDMSLTRFPLVILFSTIVVLGTIGFSSLARTVSLAAGGSKVAEQLGGTRVGADTDDPLKRRLRNVVEEIAIASGVPVPQVYVLEREAGINAFAAGYSAGERGDRGHARRAREPRPRRAAGRHRARVQPRAEWRHAAQHAPDRAAVRPHRHRDDRAHDPAYLAAQQRAAARAAAASS